MKTKYLMSIFLILWSISFSYAQSHISTGDYWCKLKPRGNQLGYCPACADQDQKDQDIKIAQEKREQEKLYEEYKKNKEKIEREREAKLVSESTDSNSTEVVINAQGSSTSYNQNEPLNNYDPNTGLYSNPLTTYNSSNTSEILQNYETGVQIANTAVAIFDLFSPSAEELAARERAETLRIKKEEEAARARAEKIHRISKRKDLIKQYPDGKTPLSYEAKNESEVYFFAYSHTPPEIENSSPKIYISGVFPLKKYGDGTWQFKTNLMDKISKINNGVTLILCGFYLSKNEAEQKHMYFLSKAQNSGFSVATLKVPDVKDTSTPSAGADFWGNQSTNNSSESESAEISENSKDSITTPATIVRLDFWGNPIKSTKVEENIPAEKKQDSTKKKTKVDFWGNPIKD